VRNNADGSVEVLAVGEEEALRQLGEKLLTGPVGAHVTALEDQSNETIVEALDPFGILK
jgi:acylphosphatase